MAKRKKSSKKKARRESVAPRASAFCSRKSKSCPSDRVIRAGKSDKDTLNKPKRKSSSLQKKKKEKPVVVRNNEPLNAGTTHIKFPEAENKLVLEYIIHASSGLLYEFLTTPSGLAEWFADDVNVNGDVFTFIWEGAKQFAEVVSRREGKSIRFHWTDRLANTYFEFKIEKNELTDETSLIITDFAESADEKNSLELFWQEQSSRLMKVLGSVV